MPSASRCAGGAPPVETRGGIHGPPLIVLARAELLGRLQDLLGEIAFPPAVWAEVTEGQDRPGAMVVRTAG